jgi:hypothetical protein
VDFHRQVRPAHPTAIGEAGGSPALVDDDGPLASSRRFDGELKCPEPPDPHEAAEASREFVEDLGRRFPDCFGCGIDRAPDKGLRQFTGLVKGRDMVAAHWAPSAAFAGADGMLLPEYVWAGLDCPGAWARELLVHETKPVAFTASLAASLSAPVAAERPHIVFAWLLERDGRKTRVGSAIVTADGEPCAVAEALWVDRRKK